MDLGWLDVINWGLAGDGRAGLALDWMDAIEQGSFSAGWR
jgi:hypothetical protein